MRSSGDITWLWKRRSGDQAHVAQEAGVSQIPSGVAPEKRETGKRYHAGDRQREEREGRKAAVEKDAKLLASMGYNKTEGWPASGDPGITRL